MLTLIKSRINENSPNFFYPTSKNKYDVFPDLFRIFVTPPTGNKTLITYIGNT